MELGEANTLPKLLIQNYHKSAEQVAMRKKDLGIWQEYTWKDSYDKVKYLALGLLGLGLETGDKVAIIGENEPEWFWGEFAVQAAGGIAAGIFPDSIPSEVKYIMEHSEAKFVLANDQEQVDKFLQIHGDLPNLKKVIYWDPKGLRNYDDPLLMSFDELLELGRKYEETYPGLFERKVNEGKSEDIAFIYYTSGTTGLPKGAMVSHRALILSNKAYLLNNPMTGKDDCMSFLGAAWIGEGMFNTLAHLNTGAKLNFPEEPETVQEDMREIGPDIISLGPRQWESMVRVILSKINDASWLKRSFYRLFLPVGYKRADDYFQQRRKPNLFWKLLCSIADRLVFYPLNDRMGTLNARISTTGSALMSPDTYRYWCALGMPLRQLYGGTEAGFISGHNSENISFDNVGMIAPIAEVRITEEQEILTRAGGQFTGYYKDPEKTKDVVRDGWFYTGDAGYITEDGYLMFLERVSELAELAGGHRYAPGYIEGRLRFSPYIKDVITIGGVDKEYVSALINIDFDNVGYWAESHGIGYTTFVDLSQKAEIAELLKKDVERVNRHLQPESRVKKYVLLHKEFDPDEAELTRTRKLRRRFMEERYKEIIAAIYEDKEGLTVETPVTYRDGRKGMTTAFLGIWTVGTGAA